RAAAITPNSHPPALKPPFPDVAVVVEVMVDVVEAAFVAGASVVSGVVAADVVGATVVAAAGAVVFGVVVVGAAVVVVVGAAATVNEKPPLCTWPSPAITS